MDKDKVIIIILLLLEDKCFIYVCCGIMYREVYIVNDIINEWKYWMNKFFSLKNKVGNVSICL